jgi:hypothetical protein
VEFPDSPESVALALLGVILQIDRERQANQPTTQFVLDTFAECLRAVRGDRGYCRERRH